MCGIIGYTGNKKATPILINGLKSLEYRGYDSSGIALNENGKISTVKSEGKLEKLIRKLTDNPSTVGIGHTRWATHGKPNETNAHPHLSQDGKFAVVHNGIIENASVIKNELIKKGYNFISETDTEVIPQLLSYHYNGNMLEALRKTFLSFDGSFAAAIICKDIPETIYAARKQSPLIVGRGKNESMLASDIPALSEGTETYAFLEDGEFAKIEKNSVEFYDSDLNIINKNFEKYNVEENKNSKENFPHFMLKEIFEQPEKIKNLLKDTQQNFPQKKEMLCKISNAKKVFIVACGSAYHTAIAGKYAIEELCGITAEVEIASEFRYRKVPLDSQSVVIVISQSGETADTVAALRLAKSKGAFVIGIVNVLPSTISKESDFVIPTNAGREIAVATTKGYTTQLASLYTLALDIAEEKETLAENELSILRNELLFIPEKISEILRNIQPIESLSKNYVNKNNIFFIGRNTDYAAACEGALKLKEISYINCLSLPAGELKHGTIALIEKDSPVIALCSNKKLFKKTMSNIEEVVSRGAEILLVSNDNLTDNKFRKITIPDCEDIFSPLLEVIPLQLLSYFIAKEKGCNIDMPKNLAKSVTVE